LRGCVDFACYGLRVSAPLYLTTSWDDGGILDLRVADALASLGLKGTFYWPVDTPRFPLQPAAVAAELIAGGMEIGAHSMTHPDLRKLSEIELAWEVGESKTRLEGHCGEQITSFCYPYGYHNRRTARAVEAAGYRLGRTTLAFHTDVMANDPFRLPTTFQMFPHSRTVHGRHAVKEGNWSGLVSWSLKARGASELVRLAGWAAEQAARVGGVVHIWGHAWELERHGLWGVLDEVLRILKGSGGAPVTNRELGDVLFDRLASGG
jgi:peptidoglycan-N-acetylglucosamine deacetylase